jgi:hypothetical protein
MLDKDSRWGYDNGLKSLIPTNLHFGILGYPFVLPDMIGGNVYGNDRLDKELFIRWMQANVFMPAVQFSVVPWDFDQEVGELKVYFCPFLEDSVMQIFVFIQFADSRYYSFRYQYSSAIPRQDTGCSSSSCD